MKKWEKVMLWIIAIIVILAAIVGVIFLINKNKDKDNSADIKSKVKDELEYVETSTISMLNKLNNLYETDTAKVKVQPKQGSDSTSSGGGGQSNEKSGSGSQESSGQGESSSGSETSGEQSENNMQIYSVQSSSVLLRDTETIDWVALETESEDLYGSWVNTILDLNSLNVSNENILAYNANLDNLITSLKDENKINSGICLANMYSLIPKYMEETSESQEKIDIQNIKSNIIFAYTIVNSGSWDNVNTKLGEAESILSKKVNSDTDVSNVKQVSINKSYVLLKELIKSTNDKNEDLFYLKYINLINELNKIN